MSPMPGGAEQGVDHRVGEHVGVGVAGEAALVLDLDPAEDQPAALGEAVAVVADPDAHPAHDPRAPRRRAARAGARGPRRRRSPSPRGRRGTRTRLVVAEADLLGQVGVGGEGEDGARPRRTSRRRRAPGRSRRPACAARRSRPRPRSRSRRSPPPPARRSSAGRARAAAGPPPQTLTRSGWARMSKRPRAGALGERLEVARARPRSGSPLPLPDVPALVVDRRLADEVDRADHVVEVARLEQRRGAVLGAGDEVALDPEPQRRRAHELAVGVEVVARLLLPERVAPEVERLGEAVDVLGDARAPRSPASAAAAR